MKSKNFLRGAFILTTGGVICKLLGAFYRVPLANILGDVGMGIYQLIYPVYAFSIVFVMSGIAGALSYLVAKNKNKYKTKELRKYLYTAIIISTVVCVMTAVGFVLFNNQFASLLGNEQADIGLIIAGVSVVFAGFISSVRGWFQGHGEMSPTAISQIFEQLFKVGIGIWLSLVLIQYGFDWAVAGAFFGVLAGEIIATLYLAIYAWVCRNKSGVVQNGRRKLSWKLAISDLTKKWLGFGVVGLVIPLTVMVDSFLVVNLLKKSGFGENISTALFGIQSGMVGSLINFPMVLAVGLSVAIVPAISALSTRREKGLVNEKINLSLKIVLTLCLPCALGMMVIASNILNIFYPTLTFSMQKVAVVLLAVSSINIVYLGILQVSTSILQALGKIYIPVVNCLLGCVIKIGLTFILVPIPNINIVGSAVAGVVAYLIPCLLNLMVLRQHAELCFGIKNLFVVLFGGILMAASTFALNFLLLETCGIIFTTIICVSFAVISYFMIIFGFDVFNKREFISAQNISVDV